MCLKSNRSGVTNNLLQFQTTNYMVSPFKVFPFSLMHFSLLCHASMRCWKDSSAMPLSSVATELYNFLMCPCVDSLCLEKRIWKLFQYSNVPLVKELPDAQHSQFCYYISCSLVLTSLFKFKILRFKNSVSILLNTSYYIYIYICVWWDQKILKMNLEHFNSQNVNVCMCLYIYISRHWHNG